MSAPTPAAPPRAVLDTMDEANARMAAEAQRMIAESRAWVVVFTTSSYEYLENTLTGARHWTLSRAVQEARRRAPTRLSEWMPAEERDRQWLAGGPRSVLAPPGAKA